MYLITKKDLWVKLIFVTGWSVFKKKFANSLKKKVVAYYRLYVIGYNIISLIIMVIILTAVVYKPQPKSFLLSQHAVEYYFCSLFTYLHHVFFWLCQVKKIHTYCGALWNLTRLNKGRVKRPQTCKNSRILISNSGLGSRTQLEPSEIANLVWRNWS